MTTTTVPLDAVGYGGSNTNDLLDARGETPDPDVGDAPANQTLLRTGPDAWSISATPSPADCPDF